MMHAERCRAILFVVCLLHFGVRADDDATAFTLAVGETRVLALDRVARVAVGHGDVLHAMVVDDTEVVLFGRTEGTSSLHVWREAGARLHFEITVLAAGAQRMRDDLQALLASVPNVQTKVVGERIVVQGDRVSDSDRARIKALAERYPQIVDFTSDIGWDRMVMLDVQVVEISKASMRELGIRWDGNTGGIDLGISWDALGDHRWIGAGGETAFARGNAPNGFSGYAGLTTKMSSRINALAEKGEALILAQPQLLARSGATADFLAGGEVPYASVDKDGKSTTLFKPYGVSLKMTPYVERNGVVRSQISVEASSVDGAMAGDSGPALKTRRASTEFNVQSGRTLVLAGFLSHDRSTKNDGLPGLMDIRFLGGLFGVQRQALRDTELAIFVTPTIVSDDHPDLQARINHASALIGQSRTEPVRMNAPIHDHGSATRTSTSDGLDIFSGQGSQWDDQPDRR